MEKQKPMLSLDKIWEIADTIAELLFLEKVITEQERYRIFFTEGQLRRYSSWREINRIKNIFASLIAKKLSGYTTDLEIQIVFKKTYFGTHSESLRCLLFKKKMEVVIENFNFGLENYSKIRDFPDETVLDIFFNKIFELLKNEKMYECSTYLRTDYLSNKRKRSLVMAKRIITVLFFKKFSSATDEFLAEKLNIDRVTMYHRMNAHIEFMDKKNPMQYASEYRDFFLHIEAMMNEK